MQFKKYFSYEKFAPFIATCFVILYAHIYMYLTGQFSWDKLSFKLLLGMLIAFIPSTIIGYLLGIIPASITSAFLYHFIQNSESHINSLKHILWLALLASCFWLVFPAILIFIDRMYAMMAFIFIILVIVPSSLVCAYIEWKKNLDNP